MDKYIYIKSIKRTQIWTVCNVLRFEFHLDTHSTSYKYKSSPLQTTYMFTHPIRQVFNCHLQLSTITAALHPLLATYSNIKQPQTYGLPQNFDQRTKQWIYFICLLVSIINMQQGQGKSQCGGFIRAVPPNEFSWEVCSGSSLLCLIKLPRHEKHKNHICGAWFIKSRW